MLDVLAALDASLQEYGGAAIWTAGRTTGKSGIDGRSSVPWLAVCSQCRSLLRRSRCLRRNSTLPYREEGGRRFTAEAAVCRAHGGSRRSQRTPRSAWNVG
jgi:hypothetical protein